MFHEFQMPESAFFLDASGPGIIRKVAADYEIQLKLVKKVLNHRIDSFRHQTPSPVIFGQNKALLPAHFIMVFGKFRFAILFYSQ